MMTTITCLCTSCTYNDYHGNCNLNDIEIDDVGACLNNKCYLDTEEYNDVFYAACTDLDKEVEHLYREVRFGKRIEYNGFTFYTRDDIRGGWYRLTEERTGLDCGTMERLEKRFDEFVELIKQRKDVMSLRVGTYDKSKKKVIYTEAKRNDNTKSN